MFIFRLANETSNRNNTLDLTYLATLCDTNQNHANIGQYLRNVLLQLELVKTNYSSNDRRSLRQRFSNLAEQCRKRNVSKDILSFVMQLADRAFKLPERMY